MTPPPTAQPSIASTPPAHPGDCIFHSHIFMVPSFTSVCIYVSPCPCHPRGTALFSDPYGDYTLMMGEGRYKSCPLLKDQGLAHQRTDLPARGSPVNLRATPVPTEAPIEKASALSPVPPFSPHALRLSCPPRGGDVFVRCLWKFSSPLHLSPNNKAAQDQVTPLYSMMCVCVCMYVGALNFFSQ